MLISHLVLAGMLAPSAPAAERVFAPYTSVKPVLEALGERVPSDLQNAGAAKWNAWSRQLDRAIRARLDAGDRDTAVNLLLFGTSFTGQPRVALDDMVEASRSGVLRARLLDLLQGLRAPAGNERLMFLRNFVRGRGMDPDTAEGSQKIGIFVLENVERVLQELRKFAQRAEDARRPGDASAEFDERSSLFRDRGVSLDTSILPNFGIEEALRDLKTRGLLHEQEVQRAAVIGPGLDFTDWDSGYDYYPQQTLQPFALSDSLLRLGLARDATPRVTVFDISPRVLDHLRQARQRASRGESYTTQLPRDPARQWLPPTVQYWRSFGDRIGEAIPAILPPAMLQTIETRAVRIRPAVVMQCEPVDLNIVLQRLEIPEAERFDLVIATNVFVYYDTVEQALAAQNVAAMLKPGGILLSNSRMPKLPAGSTTVRYAQDAKASDSILWYRK
jgi:SAM-dependent methyltransferase